MAIQYGLLNVVKHNALLYRTFVVATYGLALRNVGRLFVGKPARFVPMVYEQVMDDRTAEELTVFVNELDESTRHDLISRGGPADPQVMRQMVRLFRNRAVLVVRDCNNGGIIAGVAFLGWDGHRQSGDVSVAVGSGYRGGLGRWLIVAGCAHLALHLVNRACAFIDMHNKRSITAFTSAGFKRAADNEPWGQQNYFKTL